MSMSGLLLILGGYTLMVWHMLPQGADGDVFFGISRAFRKTYMAPLDTPRDMIDNIVRLDSYERSKR